MNRKEYLKNWKENNRNKVNQKAREYYHKNKQHIIQKSKENYQKNREYKLINVRNGKIKARFDLINKLGAYCRNCGETRFVLLQLDHINNDGEIDRNEFKTNYCMVKFYLKNIDLAKKTLQPLCANCNWLKRQQLLGVDRFNEFFSAGK